MGTICHIRPVDKDQNVSSGDAEQTWPPAEGLAEMAGVTEFAVRNYGLGLRAPRPQHLEALARALGVDPAALTDYMPSLGGMCAIDMLLAALGADGRELLDALGVEKVPYGELDMTVGAIEADRRRRGEGPLMP